MSIKRLHFSIFLFMQTKYIMTQLFFFLFVFFAKMETL